MNVEEKLCEDKFPDVLRVLAVDDDPICLEVLEKMLRKCHYHVTTANQATVALKMLRDNKKNFDIVISDVNMPDMDGFKLLELVGLEMDLPVIMLSAHSDKELVYKGVIHGAVDYLIKPVRMEVLKNIWQHVIRKKNLNPKDQNRSQNQDNSLDVAGEGGGGAAHNSSDQNGKVNRKRKDQDEEEEEEEGEENGQENEESGSQKKPRVVWSSDLHKKFVAAVDQLGPEKAVPKKILDLMGVEGLTRENVASHLQKYRLYLKRISIGGHQQANMVPPFGVKDSSYLRMSSMECLRDFHSLSGPGRFSGASRSSYSPGDMLGRLNSPGSLTLRGITSSGLFQSENSQYLSISNNAFGKLQGSILSGNKGANLFRGIASSLEPNQLQSKSTVSLEPKSTVRIEELDCKDEGTRFSLATSFPEARVSISGSLCNTVSNTPSSPLALQANLPESKTRCAFGARYSLSTQSLNQESFGVGTRGSLNFLDHNRSYKIWQGEAQCSKFPANSFPLSDPFNHNSLPTNNLRDNISSTGPHFSNSAIDFSSTSAVTAPLEHPRVDMQGQASSVDNVLHMNCTSRQRWEELSHDYNSSLSNTFSTINCLSSGNDVGLLSHSVDHRNLFEPLVGQLDNGLYSFQHSEDEKSVLDGKLRSNEDYLLDQTNSQNRFVQNNIESLEDIMNTMIKREQNESMLMDGDFGIDAYSLGSSL